MALMLQEHLDDIVDMYYNKLMSTPKIAKRYNCSKTHIIDVLGRNGYILRKGSCCHMKNVGFQLDKDIVKDLYCVKNISINEIANRFNCSIPAIHTCLKLNNIKRYGISKANKLSASKQLLNNKQKLIIKILFKLEWKLNDISRYCKINICLVGRYFSKLLKEKIEQHTDDIIKLYCIDKKSRKHIAELYNCEDPVIKSLLKNNGIALRNSLESRIATFTALLDIEKIKIMYYRDKLSLEQIASTFSCDRHTIKKSLINNGYILRKNKRMRWDSK